MLNTADLATDPMAEWCDLCMRFHQLRDRPVPCAEWGCDTMTVHYHALCPTHRVA